MIFGSGFGLYGYLPALLELEYQSIRISTKYKEKIISRKDLSIYENHINWYENEKTALNKVDTVIIALNPSNQFKEAYRVLKKGGTASFTIWGVKERSM